MKTQRVVSSDEGNGLRLFVEADQDGQVDASVLVRWSITEELKRVLADVSNPQLLLVVGRNGHEKSRKLVPLGNMFEFVTFNGPGENIVYATIVWDKKTHFEGLVKAKEFFSKRDDYGNHRVEVLERRNRKAEELDARRIDLRDRYWSSEDPEEQKRLDVEIQGLNDEYFVVVDLPDSWHTSIVNFDSINHHGGVAELAVQVPEAMFADKSSRMVEWLASLSNKILESKPRDQCAMRRRAMLGAVIALGWIPFHAVISFFYALALMVMMIVNSLFVALTLFFGRRGMRSEFIYEPFTYTVSDILRAGHHSFWLFRKEEGKTHYTRRSSVFNLMNLPVIAFALLIVWIVSMFLGTFVHLLVYGVIFLAVLFFVVWLLSREPSAEAIARQQAADEQREQRLREMQMDSLGALVAGRDFVPNSVDLDAIPAGRATLHLRYNGLKAKICKPFAR